MKRLLLSLASIGITGSIVFAATTAFFSDTETSTGNTFQAGEIDLKVDSTAHYAGMVCVSGFWVDEDDTQANNPRPDMIGDACTGSWTSTNLTQEKFFSYSDVKPGDNGENTISLTATSNEAWACIQIGNVVNDENTLIEPESESGDLTPATGELAQNMYFSAWLDQGNVLGWQCPVGLGSCPADTGEGDNIWQSVTEPLMFSNQQGPASDVLNGVTYPLFQPGLNASATMQPGTTYYLGLQWCAGEFDAAALALGSLVCDGQFMGNDTQTDQMSADIAFYVEQSRNNEDFSCANIGSVLASPTPTPTASPTPVPTPEVTPVPSPTPQPE